jgi:hypothetical protein
MINHFRRPSNELFFILTPPLDNHRYASFCFESVIYYLEATLLQLNRIWDDSRVLHCFGNLNSRFETNAQALLHGYEVQLLMRDVHFLTISFDQSRKYLSALEEIVKEAKKINHKFIEGIKTFENMFNGYHEARNYFEHLDERIQLRENNKQKKERIKQDQQKESKGKVIHSKISFNLSFPNIDPNTGILTIQDAEKTIKEIDVSKKTMNEIIAKIYEYLYLLLASCEEILNQDEKDFLNQIRAQNDFKSC